MTSFLLLLLASSSKTAVHPFFISVTELRADSQKQTFSLSCRMFTDDLQAALLKLYQYKANLEAEDGSANDQLAQYIQERVQVKIDGKSVSFRMIGYEKEEEAIWCYLEATAYPGIGKCEITDRLLYDFIPEQTNLLHFYRDGKRNSFKLVNPDQTANL